MIWQAMECFLPSAGDCGVGCGECCELLHEAGEVLTDEGFDIVGHWRQRCRVRNGRVRGMFVRGGVRLR